MTSYKFYETLWVRNLFLPQDVLFTRGLTNILTDVCNCILEKICIQFWDVPSGSQRWNGMLWFTWLALNCNTRLQNCADYRSRSKVIQDSWTAWSADHSLCRRAGWWTMPFVELFVVFCSSSISFSLSEGNIVWCLSIMRGRECCFVLFFHKHMCVGFHVITSFF